MYNRQLQLATLVDGKSVETVEGLATDGELSAEQQAFIETGGFQCGYCTPGMIMLARALIDRDPAPSRAGLRNWMGANICRCTGYEMIIEAVEKAAALQQEACNE